MDPRWEAAAQAVGTQRLTECRPGASVGERDEGAMALEGTDISIGCRAGRRELIEVSRHRGGLSVQLSGLQKISRMRDGDDWQTRDLRWKRDLCDGSTHAWR